MPQNRTNDAGHNASDPGGLFADGATKAVIGALYLLVPLAGIVVIGWLVVDAFNDSAEAGARSLCAALIPILIAAYIRWTKPSILAKLDELTDENDLALAIGAGVATIIALALLRSGPESTVTAQIILSFAFATLLLVRTDGTRGVPPAWLDPKLLNFFFGIALGLSVYGLFTLDG